MPATQQMLFDTVTTDNGDGSFTVRPKAIRIVKEIRVKRAAKLLGMSTDTVKRLCDVGEEFGGLAAYKNPSVRGNAPWRIDWESVMTYKLRRLGER